MKYLRTLLSMFIVLALVVIPRAERVQALGVEFNDTFTETGASDVTLASHAPDTGTSWTQIINNDGSCSLTVGWALDTLQEGTCGADEGAGYTADASYTSSDYYVEANDDGTASSDDYYWIGVRIADASNGYWLRWNNTTPADTTAIYEVAGGSWSVLATCSCTVTAGSVMKFEVVGSTLKGYDDGVEVVTATDSTLTAAGEAGIGAGDLTNNGTDDTPSGISITSFVVTTTQAAAAPSQAVFFYMGYVRPEPFFDLSYRLYS